jgi:uncharacterized protein YceK
MNTKILVPLLMVLSLSGCASMSDTVTTTITKTSGEVVTTVAGASIAKEQAVHDTLQEDVKGYYKALAKSGSQMKVDAYQEVVAADGSKIYLPLMSASFIEAPKRSANLPTAPSVHPAWGFAERTLGQVAKYGMIGYGIHEVSGVLEAGFDAAGNTFGDDANVQNSFNEANGSSTQTISTANKDTSCADGSCGEADEEPEQYYNDEGQCLVGPDCSCDSYEAGSCTP